jgi:hypothetical protein
LLNAQAALPNGTDPSSSAAYSIVPVDVWTTVGDVSAVLDVVKQLDLSRIEVVGADVLAQRIRLNRAE